MKTMRIIGALAVAGMAIAGCQDITNPVEETGEFGAPWVRFDVVAQQGDLDSYVPIIFEAPSRPEQDIDIEFTFGGDAVFGEDYVVVEDEGVTTPRSDVTAEGGTITLPYDPAQEQPHDTMWVYVPQDATAGRVLTVEMVGAQGQDGNEITLGYLGDFATFELTVRAPPAEIDEGPYAGVVTASNFGYNGTTTTVAVTADPVTIEGTQYRYQISDFAFGLFGGPVPWAFNVFVDGNVEFSPENPAGTVTADITGSYDFETNVLTVETELTCCGGEGLIWHADYTLQTNE